MPGLRAGGGRTYKKGGRVNRADGGTVDDNMVLRPPVPGAGKTGGPYSPSDKEQVDGRAIPRKAKGGAVHSDEKEDKELIKKTLKEEGLTPARAMGGKVDMHAGALSGPGRLEKIKLYGKNAHMKPQAV
jgi:hypothetical protein